MRKILWVNTLGLLLSSAVFASGEPALETFFFPEETEAVIVASHSDGDDLPAMEMVIFTPDEPPLDPDYYDVNDTFTLTYYLDSSYQNDFVHWSVAGPSGRPDTLTEMKWNDLEMLGFDVGIKVAMPYGLVAKADGGYAWEVSGNTRQTYYAGDDKTGAFSKIHGNTGDSYSWYGSGGIGYGFDFGSADKLAFNVTPLVGYAWREQNLKSKDGKEQLTAFNLTDPELLEKQNSYSTEWYGPWVGADMTLAAYRHHELFTTFQYHWGDYEAEGHWRQAEGLQQPKSFEHEADATGIVASSGYRYFVDDNWGLSLSVDYQNWDTNNGTEKLYLVNGEKVKSHLNEVEWDSFGLNFGVNMKF